MKNEQGCIDFWKLLLLHMGMQSSIWGDNVPLIYDFTAHLVVIILVYFPRELKPFLHIIIFKLPKWMI